VVTQAAPHYLIADGGPVTVGRTRGGDAWQARQGPGDAGSMAAAGSASNAPGLLGAAPGGVLLGMPSVRRPS
jgi:tRNA-2-methylthio-N6-dimethylallyladenosine synthase